MESLSQDDWDALNAYSDGELPAADTAALEVRLLNEPTLQQALVQIQGIGHALKSIRPKLATDPARAQTSGFPFGYLAIAASVALVLMFFGQSIFDLKSGLTPADQHQAFLQQTFSVSYENIREVSSRTDVPDLTSANLALVADVTYNNEIQALHYAGRNGCRLTLTITKAALPNVHVTPELLLASWSGTFDHYTLLATGMDANRFAAISKYIRTHFEQQDQVNTVLAMREATQTAVPCNVG